MKIYELAEMHAILAKDERYNGHRIEPNYVIYTEYYLVDQHGTDVALIDCSSGEDGDDWDLFVHEASPDGHAMPHSWVWQFPTAPDALRYLLDRLDDWRKHQI